MKLESHGIWSCFNDLCRLLFLNHVSKEISYLA